MQDSYAGWMEPASGSGAAVGHTPGMQILNGRRVLEVDVG
jgi:hypothetical protein